MQMQKNKQIILVFALLTSLIFLTLVAADEEATSTSCGNVSSSLTLSSDVTNESTCFTINASDLTLNCAGFTVTYGSGDSSGTHGINNNGGFDNITIKNCIIKKGSSTEFSAGNYGIYFSGVKNGTIY